MAKDAQKKADGDYVITINSYLKFLNAIQKNINEAIKDNLDDEMLLYLGTDTIGMAVKHAIEEANKK